MGVHRQEERLIERMIRLMNLLEENGIESESICEESLPKELLSSEDMESLQETFEFLRFIIMVSPLPS